MAMADVKSRSCFCGAAFFGHRQCSAPTSCPRQTLGGGHWHRALPLLETMNEQERASKFPMLDLRGLKKHVEAQASGRGRHALRSTPVNTPRHRDSQPGKSWPGSDSSSSFRLQSAPGVEPMTVYETRKEKEPSADPDSDSSFFGLKAKDWSQSSESEDSDSHDTRAFLEEQTVMKWRGERLIHEDSDFAFLFTSFEEAYGSGGHAVASAWSRCRLLAESNLEADAAHVLKVSEQTMRNVDLTRRKAAEAKAKAKASRVDASSLRHPGRGSAKEEDAEGPTKNSRFVSALVGIMEEAKVGWSEGMQASHQELLGLMNCAALSSLRHPVWLWAALFRSLWDLVERVLYPAAQLVESPKSSPHSLILLVLGPSNCAARSAKIWST